MHREWLSPVAQPQAKNGQIGGGADSCRNVAEFSCHLTQTRSAGWLAEQSTHILCILSTVEVHEGPEKPRVVMAHLGLVAAFDLPELPKGSQDLNEEHIMSQCSALVICFPPPPRRPPLLLQGPSRW